jgi:intracellular sulfur oxidation DsrE/DsrF family protein
VKKILMMTTTVTLTWASIAGAWPAAQSPAIPEASGYVSIPGAAFMPEEGKTYRAVFDATRGAGKPTELLPAIDMAASELNALAVESVPLAHAKFALVFHGKAIDGILDDVHYRSKFGVKNPNLVVLAEMKRQGVGLYVCGQNLAADNIDPMSLTTDVKVASDALLALIELQSQGYQLLSY